MNAAAPFVQRKWDWRAAGNFIGGGTGSGLVIGAVATGAPGWVLLVGLALIGLGLTCVWLEIGRPLRALNVFFHPGTSWMTREALVATALMPIGAAAAFGVGAFAWPAAALALAFVYCQGRILQASRGIPAWREPAVVPLIVLGGIVEGGGALLLLQAPALQARPLWLLLWGTLVVGRMLAWRGYRRRVVLVAPAAAALDASARRLGMLGGIVPMLLIGVAPSAGAASPIGVALIAAAGALVLATGVHLKFTLITRASFNQGFALPHLPVRGARR